VFRHVPSIGLADIVFNTSTVVRVMALVGSTASIRRDEKKHTILARSGTVLHVLMCSTSTCSWPVPMCVGKGSRHTSSVLPCMPLRSDENTADSRGSQHTADSRGSRGKLGESCLRPTRGRLFFGAGRPHRRVGVACMS
jgi:hypothetical protein